MLLVACGDRIPAGVECGDDAFPIFCRYLVSLECRCERFLRHSPPSRSLQAHHCSYGNSSSFLIDATTGSRKQAMISRSFSLPRAATSAVWNSRAASLQTSTITQLRTRVMSPRKWYWLAPTVHSAATPRQSRLTKRRCSTTADRSYTSTSVRHNWKREIPKHR